MISGVQEEEEEEEEEGAEIRGYLVTSLVASIGGFCPSFLRLRPLARPLRCYCLVTVS